MDNKPEDENSTQEARSLERLVRRFDAWWYDEGSGMPPLPGEDAEEHVHRVCKIAWMNGAYVKAEAPNEKLTYSDPSGGAHE